MRTYALQTLIISSIARRHLTCSSTGDDTGNRSLMTSASRAIRPSMWCSKKRPTTLPPCFLPLDLNSLFSAMILEHIHVRALMTCAR